MALETPPDKREAGRSFATVLKLMEEYPEYKFMSSQAQLYAFVKEDYPEVYEGIKKMIAAGRWEVEGSMWVESDTNVTSGESLVRQFLVGKRFFKDEFGVDNKIIVAPRCFRLQRGAPADYEEGRHQLLHDHKDILERVQQSAL